MSECLYERHQERRSIDEIPDFPEGGEIDRIFTQCLEQPSKKKDFKKYVIF